MEQNSAAFAGGGGLKEGLCTRGRGGQRARRARQHGVPWAVRHSKLIDSAQPPPATGIVSAEVTVLHSEVSGRPQVLPGATRVGSTLPATPRHPLPSLLSFLLATRPGQGCRPNAHCETERALTHLPRGAHLAACLAGLARLRASHQHAKRTPRSNC